MFARDEDAYEMKKSEALLAVLLNLLLMRTDMRVAAQTELYINSHPLYRSFQRQFDHMQRSIRYIHRVRV